MVYPQTPPQPSVRYKSISSGTMDHGHPREVHHADAQAMYEFEKSLETAPTGVSYDHYETTDDGSRQVIFYCGRIARVEKAQPTPERHKGNHVCTPGPGGKCPICRKPSGFHR